MKKIAFFIPLFLILSLSFKSFGSEPFSVNATIMEVTSYHETHSLLVPHDKSSFPLLTKNPFAFMLFVEWIDEKKIDRLSIEELKIRKSLFDYKLPLSYIEGFSLVSSIYNLDKFDLGLKKKEILSQLKQCHRNYKIEYNKYLRNNFIFLIRPTSRKFVPLQDYEFFKRIRVMSQTDDRKCYYIANKSDYNVDNQTLKVRLFTESRTVNSSDSMWQFNFFRAKRMGSNWVNLSIPIEDAKILFKNSSSIFYFTTVTVRPKKNTSYDIIRIDKYFKRNNILDSKITLHVEILPIIKGHRTGWSSKIVKNRK